LVDTRYERPTRRILPPLSGWRTMTRLVSSSFRSISDWRKRPSEKDFASWAEKGAQRQRPPATVSVR
jgi:hypothetical protein